MVVIQVDAGSPATPPPPPPPPPPLAEYSASPATFNGSSSSSSYLSPEAEEHAAAGSAVETSSLGSLSTPWGLDMIDQRSLPLDGLYHYNTLGKTLVLLSAILACC